MATQIVFVLEPIHEKLRDMLADFTVLAQQMAIMSGVFIPNCTAVKGVMNVNTLRGQT